MNEPVRDDGAPLGGHPDFHRFCDAMKTLHARKNHDYANGGRPFGNFERNAAIVALYPGLRFDTREGMALAFLLKQFDAYLFMKAQGHQSRTGEGLQERLFDIGVYIGILHTMEGEHEARRQENI